MKEGNQQLRRRLKTDGSTAAWLSVLRTLFTPYEKVEERWDARGTSRARRRMEAAMVALVPTYNRSKPCTQNPSSR